MSGQNLTTILKRLYSNILRVVGIRQTCFNQQQITDQICVQESKKCLTQKLKMFQMFCHWHKKTYGMLWGQWALPTLAGYSSNTPPWRLCDFCEFPLPRASTWRQIYKLSWIMLKFQIWFKTKCGSKLKFVHEFEKCFKTFNATKKCVRASTLAGEWVRRPSEVLQFFECGRSGMLADSAYFAA